MSASIEFNDVIPDAPLLIDALVQGRYRIVRKLGRGGMGAVYEAVDQRLGITVALKETLSAEPSMRKQFEHEARLLASLQHPALPRVTDHFVEGNRAFLVMQFIAGVDLARIIAQQPGPFPRDQVIAWADQLLDALIYLHSHDRQVIHRDIKPHNLKLAAGGQIALLDFGLARAKPSETSITASRGFFGYTRQYAPLEQIEDRRTDPRSDIYALGATLYHLLTGIKPADALERASAVINSEPDPLQPANKIYAAVGPQVAGILGKAMALRPEERYANATDFREALRRVGRINIGPVKVEMNAPAKIDSQPEETVVRQKDKAGPRLAMVESRRRFGPMAIAALLLIAGVVAFAIFYNSQERSSTNGDSSQAVARVPDTREPPPASAKADRTAVNNRAVSNTKREASDREQANERANEKKKDASDRERAAQLVNENKKEAKDRERANEKKKEAVPMNSRAAVIKWQKAANTQQARPRRSLDAPALRLPNPEFGNNIPAPSNESATRGFGTATSAPKFFRAADGTLTVKFSDGSTRVVKPGERTARPN
ncbi:MAG: eukaryotic-like serine/threonine-protein kinase [Pyrinomonadaceae bacterium]|nr:eukaryotic-like serine/threonine-protein kinase [Pyrinomonadaceae bacterium]